MRTAGGSKRLCSWGLLLRWRLLPRLLPACPGHCLSSSVCAESAWPRSPTWCCCTIPAGLGLDYSLYFVNSRPTFVEQTQVVKTQTNPQLCPIPDLDMTHTELCVCFVVLVWMCVPMSIEVQELQMVV